MENQPTRQAESRLPGASSSITERAVTGGLWMTVGNLLTKVMGGAKMWVLAYLLSVEDFGLFGLALLVVGTMSFVSSPGINTALIQKEKLDDEDLNAGFWIHAVRGVGLFLLFLPASVWLADFYGEPRLTLLLWVVSLSFLLDGFQSAGLVRLNRVLNFKRLLWPQLISNTFSLVAAIILALILHNVWALVVSHMVQVATLFVVSYCIEPFRPRLKFDWATALPLFRYGRFIFITVICYFIVSRGGDFILARLVGVEAYAYYNVALSVVGMIAGPLDQLISVVGLPALARIQDNLNRLQKAFGRTFRMTLVLSTVLFLSGAILGRDLVFLFLGEKWGPMVVPLVWLSVAAWFRSLIVPFDALHAAIGKPQFEAGLRILEMVLFLAGIFPAALWYGNAGAAAWLAMTYLVSLGAHFLAASRCIKGIGTSILSSWLGLLPLLGLQGATGIAIWRLGKGSGEALLLATVYLVLLTLYFFRCHRDLLTLILFRGAPEK